METDIDHIFQRHLGGGQKFTSYGAFEAKFREFQRETGSVFRIKSSSTVANENERRKTPIPIQFKYGSVTFCCVHYGQPKFRGRGLRLNPGFLAIGCESMMSLSYASGHLVVTKRNMKHNHTLDPKTAPLCPSNKRLKMEMKEAEPSLSLNPANKQDYSANKKIKRLKEDTYETKLKSKSENIDNGVTCGSDTLQSEKPSILITDDRFIQACEVTNRLAFLMTTTGGKAQFAHRLTQLKDIMTSWENGKDVYIVYNDNGDADDCFEVPLKS